MTGGSVEGSSKKQNNPRIGYLLRMYPRFSQTFVVNEILEVERQGVDLCIASMRKPDEGMFHESIARVKARAYYLPETVVGEGAGHLKAHWGLLRSAPAKYLRTLGSVVTRKSIGRLEWLQAAHLLRWAKKHRVEHVHVHFGTEEATLALLASRLGGLSYSLTLHAFDIFRDNVDRRLLAEKINGSRFAVTVCESNRRFLVESVPGVNPEKVRVNYNGIDLAWFKASEEPREPMSIFTVGRFIEKKGFLHLIQAVGHLRNEGVSVTCRLAGEGREKEQLVSEVKRLDLKKQVQFLGPLPQSVVGEWMRRSACFALPCIQAKDGNVDALPTVLLESLACGCPSVSTRLSGVPEIIADGESGLLVEPGDSKALAAAIRRVLLEPELAARLSRQGRQRAEERFDVTRNVGVFRGWLMDVLGTPSGRAKHPVQSNESATSEQVATLVSAA
ncbi:MAG: glycosyltransferase family 4 protein [Planctomycetota bacterium]